MRLNRIKVQKFCGIASIVSFLGGIGLATMIVVGQCLLWLKTGAWPAFPLRRIVMPIIDQTDLGEWIMHPETWLGAHRIVDSFLNLPVAMWIGGVGLAIFFPLVAIADKQSEAINAERVSDERATAV